MLVTMKLELELELRAEQADCENDFAMLLRKFADDIEAGHPVPCETYHPMIDVNGNTIGKGVLTQVRED